MKKTIGIWMIVSLVIAGFLSLFASTHPDGYEKAGEQTGFIEGATSYITAPFPDYTIPGLNTILSGSFAGILGVVMTFFVFFVLGKIIGKKQYGK